MKATEKEKAMAKRAKAIDKRIKVQMKNIPEAKESHPEEPKLGSVWLGDHWVFDFECRIWDEETKSWKTMRPWIASWFDIKSECFASYRIGVGELTTEMALTGLSYGIKSNGNRPPSVLFCDVGKEFRAEGFLTPFVTPDGTQHSVAKELGCDALVALPYTTRQMHAERALRNILKRFEDYLHAEYEACHQKEPLSLEMVFRHFAWLDKTRERQTDYWGGLEAITEEQLFLASLLPFKVMTVSRGGALLLGEQRYEAKQLQLLARQQVLVKKEMNTTSRLWAFTFKGELICEVPRVQTIPETKAAI